MKEVKDKKQVVDSAIKQDLMTLRQFFYKNEQLNREKLLVTLERTYKEDLKLESDWVDIMINKKIIF